MSQQDILIVDDEADIRDLVSGILEDESYETRTAPDGISALKQIGMRQPSLIILDVWLGDSQRDGLKILDIINRDHPLVPVIMISGHGTIETAVSAIKKGAYDFIEKPFQTERLLIVVENAIEAARLRQENTDLKLKAGVFDKLIGASTPFNHIRQLIERVAPNNSRVFIRGPSGSGKETIAREIHALSKRQKGPFITLNCAAFQENQLEIELFGTEIARLDPSIPRKIGLIEKAHKGTILLEDITYLPLTTQNQLIRVLQDNTFTRIGGTQKIDIDVRIMASSSANMEQKIAEGQFRDDLYYRLNVFNIAVPPLKDRTPDIPLLAQRFLEMLAKAYGLPSRRLTEEASIVLQSYSWPGNIRQLRNVIEWILIMGGVDAKNPIKSDSLPPEIRSGLPFSNNLTDTADIVSLPLRQAREIFERDYLLAQVSRFGGNISQTSRFVGMERSALHRKLKALGAYPKKLEDAGEQDQNSKALMA